jgi:hypothetical protein
MANVAGYHALQGSAGFIWAAAIVAGKTQPGSEIDIALEVRRSALSGGRQGPDEDLGTLVPLKRYTRFAASSCGPSAFFASVHAWFNFCVRTLKSACASEIRLSIRALASLAAVSA